MNKMGNQSCAIVFVIVSLLFHQIKDSLAGNGEIFSEKGQKSYEEDEEGKILPHR